MSDLPVAADLQLYLHLKINPSNYNIIMKHIITCFAAVGLLCSCTSVPDFKVEPVNPAAIESTSSNYINNRQPLRSAPFLKLPIGSVKPKGWLLRCIELQRDGLAGNLGEISAWLDKNNNAWLNEHGDHGWEEVPYWLRGYSNMAYLLGDKAILDETQTWIDGIFAGVKPDGYFGPVNENGDGRRELWANMLALQILQDYYDFTGDKRVLNVMTGYFKWELSYPEEKFLRDYWENSRGGDNLASVYWLYNRTGETFLLDLAHKIHRCTADWTQESTLPNWHNVNVAECFREPATYYLLSGDSTHLEATYKDFDLIRRIYGQVPGGMFGSDENCRQGYIDPRQGTETCGFVEQMLSDEILMAQTGDMKWVENLEDVAFNSLPAAFMPDYKALRYITSPNHTVSDARNHNPGIDNSGPFLAMNPFSSRCCQHNHAMGWPYFAENLVLASADGGMALLTYSDCEVSLLVADSVKIKLDESTYYPFDENVSVKLSMDTSTVFPLYFRIPSWTENATVSINGNIVDCGDMTGLAKIERKWSDGDSIHFNFPMTVSMRRWDVNQGSVSVDYGPLTLSLLIDERYERVDSREAAVWDSKWQAGADADAWPTYEIYAATPWNYGIVPDKSLIKIEKSEWPADNYPFTAANVPLKASAKGALIPSWTSNSTGLCGVLPEKGVAHGDIEDITLIPMGAARLRISAFPPVNN